MVNQVGVMNPTKNKTRVLFVDEGSYTHKQALKQSGGWILADKSQVKASEEKKKGVKSVADEAPQKPILGNEAENAEGAEGKSEATQEEVAEAKEEPTPKPKAEGKPKKATKKQEGK